MLLIFAMMAIRIPQAVHCWRNLINRLKLPHLGFRAWFKFENSVRLTGVNFTQSVAGGNTKHVEALKQSVDANKPVYVANVLNGFGIVRFTRGASDGTSGKFLKMFKRCSSADCSAADATSGFVTDWTNSQTTATSTAFTILMVVKTYSSSSDTNPWESNAFF